jgi:D-alanyl-D-alanine carboxypeptidase/D-alanyl-D-alanine-endopeptidase (penicillin-binding protein 4)
MRGGAAYKRCSAKTGTLSNVSALSGYCTTAGGDLVAFSILQNRVSPAAAHGQQDRLAAAIAGLN